MNYISQANVGGTTYNVGLPNVYINDKGNFNIETSAEIGNTTKGKINIESMDDIQLKPGDDIVLYSHHRAEGKTDEVTVKVTDGDDIPVKLEVNAQKMILTTKVDKNTDGGDMDITINSNTDKKGYLKVRARAIDLRCEEHGGIALQPKGEDSQHHMNKIKFEHGGGDGLEFGTFNAEKTSIFTDEYRFNKDGVWKMATRTKLDNTKDLPGTQGVDVGNGKYVSGTSDETQHYSYKKADDDFYDNIDNEDVTATTESIIKTANAFNGINTNTENVMGAGLIVESLACWQCTIPDTTPSETPTAITLNEGKTLTEGAYYTERSLLEIATACFLEGIAYASDTNASGINDVAMWLSFYVSVDDTTYYFILQDSSVKITTGGKLTFEATDDIELPGTNLDFGKQFAFGETENGIWFQKKYTKKGAEKNCDVIKVYAVNNNSSAHNFNSVWDPTANDNTGANQSEASSSVAAGENLVIAQCSVYDIIKLVNYMKDNSQGPWASQQ